MQNEVNSKENQDVEIDERSRRILINAILEPLKQLSIIGVSPNRLTLQERKGIELGTAEQAKNLEQGQTIRVLQHDLKKNQETIASLTATIEEKEARERELTNKIQSTWKICDIFTKHFNVLSDNYKGLEVHRDNLTEMFNKVLVVQQKEIKQLKEIAEQHVNASTEQKKLLEEAANRSTAQEKRICDLLERVSELEISLSSKENSINSFVAKNTQLLHDCENLRAENERLHSCLKQAEAEKENAHKSLAERNEVESELQASRLRIEELLRCTADYSAKNNLLTRDVEKLQGQVEDLTGTKLENEKLSVEVTSWKEKSKKTDNNCLKLEQSLQDVRAEYWNLERRYNELEKSATDRKLCDADTIRELREKLESLEEKQKEQDFNKKLEIEKLTKSFEEKHKQEVINLMASKKQIEAKLLQMEKMISEEKQNQKNINIKLAEAMKQKASLEAEVQQMKAANQKLEEELKEKATSNKHDNHETRSRENNNDLIDISITSDVKHSPVPREKSDVSTLINKRTRDTFSKSSPPMNTSEAFEKNPYDFADYSPEGNVRESISSYKELRIRSSYKLRDGYALSQPVLKSFQTPNPSKNPPLTDTNTAQQKKRRFFVSDRNGMKEATKPKKRKW